MIKKSELEIQGKLVDEYKKVSGEPFYIAYQKYWNDLLLKGASGNRESLAIDCGCGIGRMLEALSGKYRYAYGIDLSEYALKEICRNGQNIKVVTGDLQNMGFGDRTFDVAFCKGSLHHLPEPERGIKEISRVLKDGGAFIASEPCRDNILWRAMGLSFVKISKNFSDHHHLFDTRSLKEMLERNGFEIEKIRYFGYIGFPLCGIGHQFPIMRFMLLSSAVCRALVKADEICSRAPLIKRFHWHIIIHSRKEAKS